MIIESIVELIKRIAQSTSPDISTLSGGCCVSSAHENGWQSWKDEEDFGP